MREAELCVSQPPPYEPSITVSAALQSPPAPLSSPARHRALPPRDNAPVHPIPQLSVQTYSAIRQHPDASPAGLKQTIGATFV